MKTPQLLIYFLLFTALLFLTYSPLQAQSFGDNRSTDDESEFFFLGGLTPAIVTQGQVEVNWYNSLYSVRVALHGSVIESPVIDRLRLTDFNSTLDAYYGFSQNNRWNAGVRLVYGRRRLDNTAKNSPFKVFGGNDDGDSVSGLDENYSGLKEVGFRFKMIPSESIPNLTINGGYSLALNQDEEVKQYLDADRNSFDINVNYFISLNENQSSLYYFILNGLARQPGSLDINNQWLYSTSASFYVVQRLGQFSVYPGISYTLGFKPPAIKDNNSALVKNSEQVLGVLGVQYTTLSNLTLNLSMALPFILETPNPLQSLERKSYSFITVGGRMVF